jgi:hypothetical protein
MLADLLPRKRVSEFQFETTTVIRLNSVLLLAVNSTQATKSDAMVGCSPP